MCFIIILCRVALALLDLYKVSVSSRVADVEDFRTDMKRFVQNVARHCTAEKLLERAFKISVPTRRDLNLLFTANKESLKLKGVSIDQKRWVNTDIVMNQMTNGIFVCNKGLIYTNLVVLNIPFQLI